MPLFVDDVLVLPAGWATTAVDAQITYAEAVAVSYLVTEYTDGTLSWENGTLAVDDESLSEAVQALRGVEDVDWLAWEVAAQVTGEFTALLGEQWSAEIEVVADLHVMAAFDRLLLVVAALREGPQPVQTARAAASYVCTADTTWLV